ncbi:uncharacterized protein [Palaemon carinicauda]|uniref:uncharacterized protein n=1 Tax=Palaemon carinicauda TaxID=392227 RepID=UPI0035B67686
MKKPSQYRLLLRVLTTLISLGGVTYETSAAGSEPSVTYIEGSRKQFFIAPRLTFDPSNATHVLPGLNSCKCQMACFARRPTDCQAWSFFGVSGEIGECRLIDSGPETTDLLPDENAFYYFRKSSVLGTYSWQDDGLLYATLNATYYADPARERCSRIPGHRLIIVKSMKTYEFFGSLSKVNEKPPWLANLRKYSNGSILWGDGSDSTVTQGSIISNANTFESLYISYSGKVDDVGDLNAGPFRVLCQANPLGIDW